jgi:NCS1 family nucleobase:cation symporter-1
MKSMTDYPVGVATVQPESDRRWHIEQHGINFIPEADRHGTARSLFWVFAAAGFTPFFLFGGAVLIAFGLSFWQALLACGLGLTLYALVGLVGVPGPKAGTATMVISRGAFGLRGNIAPTFLAWLTVVGWQGVHLILGALALFALAEEIGITATTAVKAVILGAVSVATYLVAILGTQRLCLHKAFTLLFAGVMVGVAVQVVPTPTSASAAGSSRRRTSSPRSSSEQL